MKRTTILAALALTTACGGGSGDSVAPPVPVASVTVDPASASMLTGATTQLTATAKDASGNTLAGRTITWTSSTPTVASVSPTGIVTGVTAGGLVTITATSEGRSGSAFVTILAPITAVTIAGPTSVKVGDSYTYTATLKIADGSTVVRPFTWIVADPTKATISTTGALTPLQSGTITLGVSVDGAQWVVTTNAYDWTQFGSGTSFGVFLASDTRITSKFGTSENPSLVIGCSSGTLLAFVDTDHFITQNGLVAYAFDGGTPVAQAWLEFDAFSALGFPGPLSATRTFATLLTQSRTFAFAFTEFNSTPKAMLFRVTGLVSRINAWITQCPATLSLVTSGRATPRLTTAEAPTDAAALHDLLAAAGLGARGTSAETALRAQYRAAITGAAPSLRIVDPASMSQRAVRVRP